MQNQQSKPTPEPLFPIPTILPMEGGYKMGIVTTQKGLVMLWAHDGNDAAVRAYIEEYFPNVQRKEAILYIVDTQSNQNVEKCVH